MTAAMAMSYQAPASSSLFDSETRSASASFSVQARQARHSLPHPFSSPLRSSPSLRQMFSLHLARGRPHQRQPLAVYTMLPSATPEKISGTSPVKWSARAIKAFSMAELEARKMKYPTTGTEALLMGILTEGTSYAARYLRAHGITLFGVRDETVKLLGKADMYFFSPEHPPLTEPAQKALDWAVEERNKAGQDSEVTTTHLVLGIWAQKGSAGQQVLANLGFDDKKAEALEASVKDAVGVGKTMLD